MQNKAHRPKFHVFNGKKYNIIWKKPHKDLCGLCEPPDAPFEEREIHIAPSLESKERLETMIHEALHAELWCLDEDTVTRVAASINEFLHKCGVKLNS